MPDNVIKAKNVVSFSTGEVKESVKAAKAEAAEAVETVKAAAKTAEPAKDTAAKAVKAVASDVAETPVKKAPKAAHKAKVSGEEPIEINPLNLRKNRYLDEAPQGPDWADEADSFDAFESEEEAEDLSTFTEVFIPLHDDSTGTVIRKGMVIVSVIVIVCCLVAIFMKMGAVGGTILPDFSALAEQAACVASAVPFDL